MSKKLFDFQDQLKIGNKGENSFVKYYPELAPVKSKEREIDFTLNNGKTVELKSDSYSLEETENFFIEMYGNTKNSTLGGPFRSLQDKIDYFVYFFPRNKVFFWFETAKLCEKVEKVIFDLKLKPKIIRNKGWDASGFAVPRRELECVLLRMDDFNK